MRTPSAGLLFFGKLLFFGEELAGTGRC